MNRSNEYIWIVEGVANTGGIWHPMGHFVSRDNALTEMIHFEDIYPDMTFRVSVFERKTNWASEITKILRAAAL